MHQALLRHPWACALVMSDARTRPARLQYMDALLGRLRETGFPAETTYHAYHVLDAHIFGFATLAGQPLLHRSRRIGDGREAHPARAAR